MTLYEALLKERFDLLSLKIQAMHRYEKQNILRGSVTIKRGNTLFAKFMSILMRLPKEQEKADMMLELTQKSTQEHWKRTFGSDIFSSVQYKIDDYMVEKMGFIKMYFNVFEKEKTLYTVLEKSSVLGLKIPKIFSVHIASIVEEVHGKIHFFVKVSSSTKILIIEYNGVIDI